INWTEIDIETVFSDNCGLTANIAELEIPTFFAYPNPTKDILHIGVGEKSGNIKTLLSNSLGEVILTSPVYEPGEGTITFNCPPRVYYLTIESKNRTRQTIKDIKA